MLKISKSRQFFFLRSSEFPQGAKIALKSPPFLFFLCSPHYVRPQGRKERKSFFRKKHRRFTLLPIYATKPPPWEKIKKRVYSKEEAEKARLFFLTYATKPVLLRILFY